MEMRPSRSGGPQTSMSDSTVCKSPTITRALAKSNGAVFIEDTGSTNGVYVNGTRIKSKVQIVATDTVQIGPFLLLG
jgi:hypothetical protein